MWRNSFFLNQRSRPTAFVVAVGALRVDGLALVAFPGGDLKVAGPRAGASQRRSGRMRQRVAVRPGSGL